MRLRNGRIGLSIALSFALALPVAAAERDAGLADFDAWQGQGQGQGGGRGNDERGGRGNSGRGNDDQGQARGNQGRGNDDAGRGQGRGEGQGRGNQDDDRGNDGARGNSGNSGNSGGGVGRGRRHDRPDPVAVRAQLDRMPSNLRELATSRRGNGRLVVGAVTRASLRGVEADRLRIAQSGSRWTVRNDRDEVLFDIDDDRDLGHWEMRRLGDRRPNENSPAFCRSGEGHPVWGREWCIEKGFGLGVGERSIWSRATIDDVIFRKPPITGIVDRPSLIEVLGDVVFGRLAVQSLALGYDEPLVGRWVASTEEVDAPWVLKVSAGNVAVAELVDTDRDDEVDVLYVVQPRW